MQPDKHTIRESLLQQRNALTADDVAESSAAVLTRLAASPFYADADCISCFVSFQNEVCTHDIIRRIIEDDKRVAVPLCRKGRRLVHRRIGSLDDLSPSRFGLLEPTNPELAEVAPSDIDLALVPGLAFDRSGNRVGFGAGYYDGFLSEVTCPKVALAFDFQVLDAVPVEPHDVPLDAIITESRIIYCGT